MIYLIEVNDGPVAKALRSFQQDKDAMRQAWLDWAREHLPSDALMREWSDGQVAGFAFPSGIPDGWKKPNKNGTCWPRKNNPILKTMPLNKRFKRPEEYLEEVGITAPTMIFEKNNDGETWASWGIGNFFNPVQFVWAGLEEDAPKGVVTPDYAYELREGAKRIRNGCTMQPPEDFDWQNLLPGCRVIPRYEWDYLVGKWQETRNDAEEQEA
ncbi:hypothetical protein [Neisseria dentiae]|jgi:putative uncharacterized protein rth12|uniref:hypothetical protein n=1 Tax=Neisseria dentiae TaxID=194197 RepID=UPI00211C2889|nr:hypothetical protein [Neisseria dentiae]MCQ9325804.1 hypothetical protein [Neisseria dentiae]